MCETCGKMVGHDPRCPEYISKTTIHYCSFCGDGICDGEEYIENLDGDYRHYDCFSGMRDLLEWFGYEVKIMEDTLCLEESKC